MSIKVISYDVWQTLVKANPKYVSLRGEMIAKHLNWPDSPVVLAKAVKQASKELDRRMDTTGIQYGFIPRVKLACEMLGLAIPNPEQLDQLQHEVVRAHLDHLPHLVDSSLPMIFQYLHAEGRKIAVISNTGMTEGEILYKILEALGLLQYVSYELYSDALGMAKPDPRVFNELVRQAGVNAQDILHIGDNKIADYDGALNANLQALWYAPTESHSNGVLACHRDLLEHTLLTVSK